MKKMLTNNLGLKLASLMLAFVLWFLVVMIEDPQDKVTFNNVPVKIVNTDLLEQEEKVYEVLDDTDNVRVTVYAPKSIIGQIRATDIVAEADVSKLTDINTIAIDVYVQNVAVDRIESNRDVIRLNVEDRSREWIRLTGTTVGDVADGYMVYSTALDQTNIEVTGPESVVSQVDYATVEMDVSGATTNLSANVDIQLYNADGVKVEHDNLKKNVNSAYMTVEVLATKDVPVEVQYIGEPAEGYMTTGVVETDTPVVKIAAKPSVLDSIHAITIPAERLDITDAEANVVEVVNLKDYLPDNVKFADKSFTGKATATVYIEPIVTQEIEVPLENISFINMPAEFEAEWPDDMENYSLTISGLGEYISAVQPENIMGYVDVADYMSGRNMEELIEGEYTVPVTFELSEDINVDEQLRIKVIFVIPDED